MSLDSTRDWLVAVLRPYPSRDRILLEVLEVLRKHRTLSVKTDAFTFNSGHTALLLLLHGTLPINYKNATYHIPVHIWLAHEYPRMPPVAFVVPTSTMGVRKSREIDPSGRVRDEVVDSWWNSLPVHARDLEAIISKLVVLFETVPPVYAKPPEQRPSQTRPMQPIPSTTEQLPEYGADQPPARQASTSYPAVVQGDSQQGPHSRSNSMSRSIASPPVPPRPGQQPPVPQRPYARPGAAQPVSPVSPYSAPTPAQHFPSQQPPHTHNHAQQEHHTGPVQYNAPQWSQPPSSGGPVPPAAAPHSNRNSLPPQPAQPGPSSVPSLPLQVRTKPTDIMDSPDAPAPPMPDKPPPPSTIHLHSILLPHLQASLGPLMSDLNAQRYHLQERKEDLSSGEPAVRDEMARLEAVKKVCETVGNKLEGVVNAGERRVAELEERGDVEVDEVVCSISIVHNQLIDLVAEDNAISDTIYHVTRALDAERLDIDRYLKAVRALAREQYMKRALVERILSGMGQKTWD